MYCQINRGHQKNYKYVYVIKNVWVPSLYRVVRKKWEYLVSIEQVESVTNGMFFVLSALYWASSEMEMAQWGSKLILDFIFKI